MNKYRSHNCSELTENDSGKIVSLSGWLHRKRDHGNLLFIDLRDHFGLTQCVIENNSKFFSELEKLDLTFDAWLYHTQLDELVLLAREFPTTKIVLNHLGCPLGIGPYKNSRSDVFADWKSKISALARCENIYVKLGGLNMSMAGFDWQKRPSPPDSKELTGAIEPYFDKCVDLFGASRCMLESNFPVDRVAGNYTVLWNAFKRATEKYSQSERESLFYKTAVEFYGLTN